MENIYNNNILKKEKIYKDKKVISKLNIKQEDKEGYEEIVKKFIKLESFPYISTEYAELVKDPIENDLTELDKIQIVAHIKAMMKEFDIAITEYVNKKDIDTIRKDFFYDEWTGENKEEIISSIKGGEYAEIMLNQILIDNGYDKVLSKINEQWGRVCPTGIDVVYVNLEKKKLVLIESKFYKKYLDALKSVNKDLKDIIDGDKLDNELLEWEKRIKQMSEKLQTWYADMIHLNKNNKIGLMEYFDEIYVIGFVMSNKNRNFDKKVEEYKLEYKNKEYKTLLISVPIISKDKFILSCFSRIDELKGEL